MKAIITATEAVKKIKSGSTIATSGFVGSLIPEHILKEMQKQYCEYKKPRNLTLIYAAGQGDGDTKGLNHLGEEGLLECVIGGHFNLSPKIGKLIMENKIKAYNFPQGTLSQWFRDMAGRRAGTFTKVGLRTFVDPRIEGGKINSITTEDRVDVIVMNNEEWLWYHPCRIDVAIIRGTYADENGNITLNEECGYGEVLALAQAAKASGGMVIVQVKNIVKSGTLDAKQVKVPGIFVDYVVQSPGEDHWMTWEFGINPALNGTIQIPLASLPPAPLTNRKIIARRSLMELKENAVVNLGIGVPEGIALVAAEEGITDMILTTEAGTIGGVPSGGRSFGAATNAQAILEQPAQFDFYDGGGIDIAFLGLAEADKKGNINVSKFKGRVSGCGGFINITQNSKKVVYCGTFTAGGLKEIIENNKITIVQEGKNKKFLDQVEQITFSGEYALSIAQPVLYITERAVFKLTEMGLELIEVAPGIDIDKDILSNMDFKPIINKVKVMDERIFRDEPMGVKLNY